MGKFLTAPFIKRDLFSENNKGSWSHLSVI